MVPGGLHRLEARVPSLDLRYECSPVGCKRDRSLIQRRLVGFDLVGHEDPLRPLIYYIDPLKRFVQRQKEVGVDIPFMFHAGETLGDGTPADMNLYDAILLGTKRIGHGSAGYAPGDQKHKV